MKSACCLMLMVLAAAASAQTATAPVASTQPSPPAAILVVAFSPPTSGQYPWIGEAMTRDLLADLQEATHARIDLFTTPLPNPQEACRAAVSRNDSVAVWAVCRLSGNQVRVRGQVTDANTGATLGTLDATAPSNNLFPLEDQLVAQVVTVVPRQWVNVPASLPPTPGAPTSEGYATAAAPEYQSFVSPDYAAYPPGYYAPYGDYSYPSAYYYPYAYPSWWWYEPYVWYGSIYYHGYWHHHYWGGPYGWYGHYGHPWYHGYAGPHYLGPHPYGSPYGPHGPQAGHIGGAGGGHPGGGHVAR